MKISKQGLDFIKGFESFVPYVYDDLVAPVKGKYKEWAGGKAKGTLTIGYGHTNAAKHPLKIEKGLRISEAQACEILDVDLDECEEAVNDLVKVELTQGMFDALVSFTFNCGVGNLKRLIVPLNLGNYGSTRAALDSYVYSKGKRLAGLQRRRDGEQALWDSNQPSVLDGVEVVEHPADVDAPPTVTVTTLVAVSRKASGTLWFKRVWKGLSIAGVLSSLGLAKDTADQVGQVVADHWLAILITTGVLLILFAKWLEGLMVEDVNEGRSTPSGKAT